MPRIPLFLLLFLLATMLSAQLPDSCKLHIGTNLAGPADWGAEWPFVDIMKYGRTWTTHNNQWVDGGENAWDTQVLDQIPLDEQGYPLYLPVEVPGAEAPQMVLTVWANTEALPAGTYIVLYDGQGEITFWGDGQVTAQEPGRMEVMVTPGVADIMTMELRSSQEGNHLRNIRVLLPGHEATYTEQPWTPAWWDKLAPFQALRFMDWGYTNGSLLQDWSDRPRIDDYTYTQDGVPYEWWVQLCNDKQADAWVCVPHLASDDYIEQMATLFRDNLDPNLTIYVEYSNEIWNWIFPQTHHCFNEGDQEVPWPERIVPFVQNALDIWTEVFAGQEHRLVRVVGVQGSWQDVSNRIVNNLTPGSFDAFAPAAYFGFSEDGIGALESLGASATAEDVLYWAREGMLSHSFGWLQEQYQSLAQPLGIPMLYYEGGQHLTPEPFGSEQSYNPALVAAQSHPGMYDLYQEWYDSLRTLVQGDTPGLLMNFSFIGPTSGQYGSWGLLENQFQTSAPWPPKYRAVLDNIGNCSLTATTDPSASAHTLRLFPNPNRGTFALSLPDGQPWDYALYTLTGQLVQTGQGQGEAQLTLPVASGLYLLAVRPMGLEEVVWRKVSVR
ncbi:MAG: T9SS type A sorting domain-containing protein [Lewinella sp.]|nr:T9SS type A sorting domain-containing protein [Lewinella sp.]